MKSPRYFRKIHGRPWFIGDQGFMGAKDRPLSRRQAARSAAPRHHCDAKRGVENELRPRLETMTCEHLLGRAPSADPGKHQLPAGQPHMRGGGEVESVKADREE